MAFNSPLPGLGFCDGCALAGVPGFDVPDEEVHVAGLLPVEPFVLSRARLDGERCGVDARGLAGRVVKAQEARVDFYVRARHLQLAADHHLVGAQHELLQRRAILQLLEEPVAAPLPLQHEPDARGRDLLRHHLRAAVIADLLYVVEAELASVLLGVGGVEAARGVGRRLGDVLDEVELGGQTRVRRDENLLRLLLVADTRVYPDGELVLVFRRRLVSEAARLLVDKRAARRAGDGALHEPRALAEGARHFEGERFALPSGERRNASEGVCGGHDFLLAVLRDLVLKVRAAPVRHRPGPTSESDSQG